MAEEEEKVMGEWLKEDEEKMNEPKQEPHLNDLQFTKLDELLTQTQLYSEFLLEKMDTITMNALENDNQTVKEGNKGRCSKRKAGTSYNTACIAVSLSSKKT